MTFGISTTAVAANTAGAISVTRGGITRQDGLTVKPAVMSAVTLTPSSVQGGGSVSVRLTLTGPAPAGVVVNVTSSKPAIAPVPATVTVPGGQTLVDFTITTSTVTSNTNASISATLGVNRSATLTVIR